MTGEPPDQAKYYTSYRGRHQAVRYRSYMRLGKVFALHELFHRAGIDLGGRRILDYGFGSGAFLRSLAPKTPVAGVELDPVNVDSVASMLNGLGFTDLDLETIDVERWHEHRFFDEQFDLVVLSHVLEHLDQPEVLLRRLRGESTADGEVVCLLPINERRPEPEHRWRCDEALVCDWARKSGFEVAHYFECDRSAAVIQPLIQMTGRVGRIVAQATAFTLGLIASSLGRRRWITVDERVGSSLRVPPAQAAFVLRPIDPPAV